MSFAGLLINTCTIRRWTSGGTDAYGNPVKIWADHLTDQACRLSHPKGKQLQRETEVVLVEDVLFTNDVDVVEQDRVIVDGTAYEILFVARLQDGLGVHHKELALKRVIP